MGSSGGGIRRQCREIGGARDAYLRTGGHEVLEKLRNVLVVDIQLVFEVVELGLPEHLPPLALERGILRLRRLPGTLVGALVSRGRALLEGRRSVDFGLHIRRPTQPATSVKARVNAMATDVARVI